MIQNIPRLILYYWFVAVAFTCAGTSSQTVYTVQDLGVLEDLGGRSDSGPAAINRAGVIAGSNVTNGNYQALMYSGTWNTLGTLGGAESLAAGLNDLGRVVGFSQTLDGTTNAFLWTPSATDGVVGNRQMKSLGTLGGLVSEAYAINNSGQITGYSDVPARPTTQQHAFVYSAGKMVDIGAQLSQVPNSFGYAINQHGHVAGTAFDIAYSTPHAFYFDGTNSVDLGVFGGVGASGLAMNDNDYIAGYLTTTSMVDHAFGYLNGTVTDLGTLGGHYSYALGINNSNVIVGGSFVDTKDSIYHAFVSKNGLMQDLNTNVDSSGTGWTLVEARAINDTGQITGVGTFAGVNHAFLLSSTNQPINTNAAPELSLFWGIGSSLVVQFTTKVGNQYTVQTNSDLTVSGWANADAPVNGTGSTVFVTNAVPGGSSVFYRLKVSGP